MDALIGIIRRCRLCGVWRSIERFRGTSKVCMACAAQERLN